MAGHLSNFKPRAMTGNSQPVHSTQQGCHEQLEALVLKHLENPSRRPPAAHTVSAFEAIREQVEASERPLVFDSFCGTGMSTALLAERLADCLVIGIDKSNYRLGKHREAERDNYLLVQADCGDFWRLAANHGWKLTAHYLLYPNPWPKPGQVKRRVHGSPDFIALLELGGEVELRSNWRVYAEEFALALATAGCTADCEPFTPEQPLTLFERKYFESGHELWRCQCKLVHNTHPRDCEVTP